MEELQRPVGDNTGASNGGPRQAGDANQQARRGHPSAKTLKVREQFHAFFEVFDNLLPYYNLDEATKNYVEQ